MMGLSGWQAAPPDALEGMVLQARAAQAWEAAGHRPSCLALEGHAGEIAERWAAGERLEPELEAAARELTRCPLCRGTLEQTTRVLGGEPPRWSSPTLRRLRAAALVIPALAALFLLVVAWPGAGSGPVQPLAERTPTLSWTPPQLEHEVRRVLEDARLTRCEIRPAAGEASSRSQLELQVGPDGRVESVALLDAGAGGARVGACLQQALSELRFDGAAVTGATLSIEWTVEYRLAGVGAGGSLWDRGS